MTLSELVLWVKGVPETLPEPMRPMAENICASFLETAKRLLDLGLSYLTLDRSAESLSTGERQRMQLARAVRNRTTGVLYVLDEPSIGLHPANIMGLIGVMRDLIRDGNSVVLVDHDVQILNAADWMIEMGPEAGAGGGTVIAEGPLKAIEALILESLLPALEAQLAGKPLPSHVKSIDALEIRQVKLVDATPIGINVRSTVATYANVHDELRKVFARTEDAKALGWKASDFSYNTGKLRCPVCDGTGIVSLDVQFLPDVDIPCPECRGSRYAADAQKVKHRNKENESYSLPEIMAMDITSALKACDGLKIVSQRLKTLEDLGLGYLTLGEATPMLSGGEAQRLKLASEMGKTQSDAIFVFDEPTIGLHPLDVMTLLKVFQRLIENGATVIVIEHDLDVIRNADWIIDLGPGGGTEGGRIVASGTPSDIKGTPESQTGRFI